MDVPTFGLYRCAQSVPKEAKNVTIFENVDGINRNIINMLCRN
jgi:hypothetical protein